MAAITLNGKDRYVVYEVVTAAFRRGTTHFPQTTRIRILELDPVMLFKRLLTGKLTLNRANDPVVKTTVKTWYHVSTYNYEHSLRQAQTMCKQLNERIQND